MCAYLRYASTMERFPTYTCLLAILLCIVFVTALCSVAWHITYLGPITVPLACMPCSGCVPWGWWGAVPGGGWPATVVRGVWCQALSLPRPSVLWGG